MGASGQYRCCCEPTIGLACPFCAGDMPAAVDSTFDAVGTGLLWQNESFIYKLFTPAGGTFRLPQTESPCTYELQYEAALRIRCYHSEEESDNDDAFLDTTAIVPLIIRAIVTSPGGHTQTTLGWHYENFDVNEDVFVAATVLFSDTVLGCPNVMRAYTNEATMRPTSAITTPPVHLRGGTAVLSPVWFP